METDAGPSGRERTTPEPTRLRVRLLGGFGLEHGHGTIDPSVWRRPAAQTIVKLLALAPGHSLSREHIMHVCWPDVTLEAARARLRVGLHAARRSLEPSLTAGVRSSYLVAEGDRLALTGLVTVDVDDVVSRARRALASVPPKLRDQVTAASDVPTLVDLEAETARPLLPEDAGADWAEPTRRELARLHRTLMLALASAARSAGTPDVALARLERLVGQDPSDEELTRELMRLLVASGQLGGAVTAYNRLTDVLSSDFGTSPTEATRLLRAELTSTDPAPSAVGSSVRHLPREVRRKLDAISTVELPDRRGIERELTRWISDPAGERSASLFIVSGEAGSGRTTLVGRAASTFARKGGVVLWGGACAGEGRQPYGPVVEAVDGWLTEQYAVSRRELLRRHPHVTGLLPGPMDAGLEAVMANTPAAVPVDRRDQAALFRDVASLLGDVADIAPVVLVIEDLQDADLGTVRLLHHLTRTVGHRSIRFVVTVREGRGANRGPWSAQGVTASGDRRDADGQLIADEVDGVLVALARQGLVHRIDLLGLTRRDSDTLVRAIHGGVTEGHVAEADLKSLFDLASGNPLFVSELAHELARGRGSATEDMDASASERQRDGMRGAMVPTLPASLTHLISARVGVLGESARGLLAVLSVTGGATSVAEVAETARDGLNPPIAGPDLDDAIDEAVRLRLVDEPDVVVGGVNVPGLALRHPVIGLAVLQQLSRARRRRLDAAFAAAVQRHRPSAVETIATHLDRAEATDAETWLLRAARRSVSLYADDSADRFYSALLRRHTASRRTVDETADPMIDWAHVLVRQGHFDRADQMLSALLAELSPAHASWNRGASTLAGVLGRTGRFDEGVRLLTSDSYVGAHKSAMDEAEGQRALADLLFTVGRYSEAIGAVDILESRARRLDDERAALGLHGQAAHIRAASLVLLRRETEAGHAARTALEIGETMGDLALQARSLSVLRELSLHSGHLDAALRLGRRAHAIVERIGDPMAHAFERVNLALIQLALGQEAEARRTAASALRLARSYDDNWCLPYALLGLGEVALRSAALDLDATRRLLTEAVDVATARGDAQAKSAADTLLAELDLARGGADAALARLAAASAEAEMIRTRVVRADALVLAGQPSSGLALARGAVSATADSGDRLVLIDARRVAGRAFGALGRWADAERELREARRIADAVGHVSAEHRITQTQRWLDDLRASPATRGASRSNWTK